MRYDFWDAALVSWTVQGSSRPRELSESDFSSLAYTVGGGHVLHMICDLTIAADNARFGQTGPKVGSFDRDKRRGLQPDTRATKRRLLA
jgi:hypothetical protein